jgi:hypothetical protein
MLQKDPQLRISSVRLVGAELEAILQGNTAVSDTKSDMPIVKEGRFDDSTPHSSIPRHNLPIQITPFIGRANELQELKNIGVPSTESPGYNFCRRWDGQKHVYQSKSLKHM